MSNTLEILLVFIGVVVIMAVIFLVIRQFVLWYWKIDQIAADLHVIANHYRSLQRPRPRASPRTPQLERDQTEQVYYSTDTVRVTNKRLVVGPDEWPMNLIQPVQVDDAGALAKERYRIRLLDENGNEIHFLKSDNQERINQLADAINRAIAT